MEISIWNCKIISAFPGVGKTYFYEQNKDDLFVSDSDSSRFPKDGFPENYMDHIELLPGNVAIILVSSHAAVRAAMAERRLRYVLVYPQMHLKDVYLQRYKDRGSPQGFIDLLDKNWEEWIKSCEEDPTPFHIRLAYPGETLSSVVKWRPS